MNRQQKRQIEKLRNIIFSNLDQLLRTLKEANKTAPLTQQLLKFTFDKAKLKIKAKNDLAELVSQKYNTWLFLAYNYSCNWAIENNKQDVPYEVVENKINGMKVELGNALKNIG